MRGDVKVFVNGEEVRLRLTIGALEEIQEGDFAPGVVYGALGSGVYTIGELSAVLTAALKAAGEEVTASQVIDAVGIQPAAMLAFQALAWIYDPDNAGNAIAAVVGEAAAAISPQNLDS